MARDDGNHDDEYITVDCGDIDHRVLMLINDDNTAMAGNGYWHYNQDSNNCIDNNHIFIQW